MTALRALLGIVGVVAFVYAWPALFLLSERDFGVAIAISAGCVLGLGLIRAIRTDREADRADRERIRRGRAEVWARRDECGLLSVRTNPPIPRKKDIA